MSVSYQQRILAAANKIFVENGYRQADMRSIAKEAGIAVGTIYNYYPNKAVLYQAILNQQWEEFDRRIHQVVNDLSSSAREKLQRITEHLFSFVAHHMSMWREIINDPQRDEFQLLDEGHKAQQKAHNQLKEHLRRVFNEHTSEPSWIVERHILAYMAAVTHIGMLFPAETEQNINYIMSLIDNMPRLSK
ncbi:TetR/AcrR family transcriptional regulator [Aneurinibacillus uraniidurans]|uniref:TetR/AcrR family transcriptional regulator n=1 Tax=Aneurinibacillus uraniidurans TaxID=2966586 RepID=UPI002349F2BE|nr:TetR/AcrR family transcriptional regulator [Aneurinibacillus sp. B1]WCN38980.1 TetR/AcrR family transcriptional regulator [Aneurinibacillus sp. B1]